MHVHRIIRTISFFSTSVEIQPDNVCAFFLKLWGSIGKSKMA